MRKVSLDEDEDNFVICGANWGGKDVENPVQALVDGSQLRINLSQPLDQGFTDPWPGNRKSLSVLFQVQPHPGYCLFVGKEGDGEVVLNQDACQYSYRPDRSDNNFAIHGVTWGCKEIRTDFVYQLLANYASNNKPFRLSNETFADDGWPTMPKTAAIFYRVPGRRM